MLKKELKYYSYLDFENNKLSINELIKEKSENPTEINILNEEPNTITENLLKIDCQFIDIEQIRKDFPITKVNFKLNKQIQDYYFILEIL